MKMRFHAFHSLYNDRLAIATKPFNARGAKVKRCPQCQIAQQYCICQYQPDVESNIAVLLLVSDAEILKPSNTGRLILDTVKEGYAYAWSRTEPDSRLLALLSDERYQPIVVFPEDYVDDKSRLLTLEKKHGAIDTAKKPLFIFLDGSWREARRIFRKSPYLDEFPVCSIKPEAISNYVMRKSSIEEHLATAEVASLVFEQFGEAKASQVLDHWFAAFRESYMMSKTRYSIDHTRPDLHKYIAMIGNETSL